MAESSSDRILAARIAGTATRYSRQRLTSDERAAAVAALAELAAGRADLLAEVAGLTAGAAEGELDEPLRLAAAQLCVDAGADPGRIMYWSGVAQQRIAEARANRVHGRLLVGDHV